MEKFSISLLPLLLVFFNNILQMAESTAAQNPKATDFIKTSCSATRYPALCVDCLASYASTVQQNEQQLAKASLEVSLSRAQAASTFVYGLSKLKGINRREYLAVKDCIQNMGDTVAQLSQSLKELGGMRILAGQNFFWHVGNVKTWVSAALTNENTCLDGFSSPAMDGNVKISIRRRVLNCAQVTSNALALVNRFAARHKAGGIP
ncbi:21 kDa -like [Olea europaea subsp. europaea]|uniref:21 kDa -like n=1 Tax=Olea europaea subsp. europaea TaxID=158383 RepID=A0A8S0UPS2_OLEEU|nr:21 kDa -like [Olea europaea subsp. europaea]